MKRKPLAGSTFAPLARARRVGALAAETKLRVSVVVRPETASPDALAEGVLLPRERTYLTREELRRHGSASDHLDLVTRFAAEHGLRVISSSRRQRTVVLEGTPPQLQAAFGIEGFDRYEHPAGDHHGHRGRVHLPEELHGVVEAVLGLHGKPLARPRVAVGGGTRTGRSVAELAAIYAFPDKLRGAGQTVAIIELGGGYRPADVAAFLAPLGIAPPAIAELGVDGAANTPADPALLAELTALMAGEEDISAAAAALVAPALSTYETTMDVEIVAGFAPGAKIVVLFAENSERGLWHALQQAVHEVEPQPTVLNLSWSWDETEEASQEGGWNPLVFSIDGVLRDAANLGMTFCASSGDDGSSPDAQGRPTVHFPASSPHALACGGTAFASPDSTVEVVWEGPWRGLPGASSGGASRIFEQPAWQQGVGVPPSPVTPDQPARGVPDAAAVAAPHSCAPIVLGGVWIPAMGTSAAAPLWAALVACCGEGLKAPVGYLNPLLYKLARERPGLLHPVTSGSNGDYEAGPGWNACTGLGTPIGRRLLAALGGA